MNRLSRRAAALLAALASATLGTAVATSHADAAGTRGITITGVASSNPAGDAVDYAFQVANTNGPALTDLTVTGTSDGTGQQPEITCPQSSLPAGVTEVCTGSYGLTAVDMSAGTVTYTAKVSGTDTTDVPVSGPSASAVYTVQHPTFIDSPDITNDDIGDLNKLSGGAAVTATYGNSWNPAMEDSVDWAYDTIASYQPTDYLISGDLVEGRWGEPGDASGLFGAQSDPATRIQKMADFYHGENVRRLEDAGLFDKLYAIPGDHDYGDNWWRVDDPTGYGKTKYDNFDIWRNSFYEHYLSNADGSPRFSDRPTGTQWDKTAYATMISPDMLLVSVDVFDRLDNTDNVGNKVAVQVVDGQLSWLEKVLAKARAAGSPVKWIVVQGHVPVLTPVRVSHSSGMHLAGRTTAFWQAMKKYKVNLYLAGEVHATTRRSLNGITQITTGAPLAYTGQTTFVAVNEHSDHLGLVDWGWNVPENAPNAPSWDGACAVSAIEANKNACPPGRVVPMNYDYKGLEPSVEGTLNISSDNTADYGTGNLIEYVNPPTPAPAPEHAAIPLQSTATPTSVGAAGKPVKYSYRVSNTGNVALSTVAVRTTFNGKGIAPVITCPQDTLPVGVSETCTARYTVTRADVAAGAPVADIATVGAVSSTGSAVSSNKTTTAVAMPRLPSTSLFTRASIRSIGKAGAKITYVYTVKNTGNTALTAVKVRRLTHTGTGNWTTTTCPTTSGLALGASTTCTATYTSTQSDVEAGKAVASTALAGARSPAGAAVSSNISKVSTPVTQRPSLSLTARASVGSVRNAGQKITFRFAVKNNGNVRLNYLHVDAGLSGRGSRSGFTYLTKTLAPGAGTTVSVVYTVARADIAAGKPITSTSAVTGRRFATGRTTKSGTSHVRVAVD